MRDALLDTCPPEPSSTALPTARRPRPASLARIGWLGRWAWLVAGPFFLLAQMLVQAAWSTPFSWARNNVSDLGNVRCGPWGDDGRYVCSPLHAVMNAAFVVTGLLLLGGVIALWRAEHLGRSRTAGVLLGLAASGYVVAGLVPADRNENLHVLTGAVPVFFGAAFGLLVVAGGRHARRWVRVLALATGAVCLAGTALLLTGHTLGLGTGGMERVAAWPLHVFVLVTALTVSAPLSTPGQRRPSPQARSPRTRTRQDR